MIFFSPRYYQFILILFLLILFLDVEGQEYSYRHYTVRDGLPQNQIIFLFQDSDGYLWVATKGGVSRFDGNTFVNYTINDGLLANHVLRVLEDTQGRINFWTYKGLCRLENDTIRNVYLSDTLQPNQKIFFVARPEGSEWWLHDKDHFKIYSGIKETNKFILPKEFRNDTVLKVVSDDINNKIWLSIQNKGIFSVQDSVVEKFDFPPESRVQEIGIDEFIIYNNNQIYSIESSRGTPNIELKFEGMSGAKPAKGKDGTLYATLGFHKIKMFNGDNASLLKKSFNYINFLHVDSENNLWIATETGLYRQISTAFENFTVENGCPEYVWSIVEDGMGTIWCASYGDGLGKYTGGEFEKVDSYSALYNFEDGSFFYTGAERFRDGSLYFPVKGDGLLKYDGEKFILPKGFPSGSAMDVVEDTAQNKLLLASTAGLVIWESPTDVKIHGGKYTDSKSYIKSIAIDKYGRYWLGGEYILDIYDGEKFIQFPNEDSDYNAGAISIFSDHRQNLWLGTTSGLYFYDYTDFRKIAEPVLRSQVASFTSSESLLLYMGVSEGLAVLDLQKFYEYGVEEVKIFGENEGFMGFDCIRNGILRDSKGYIWVAASDRLVKYDPEKFDKDTLAPILTIDDLVFDNTVGIPESKTISPDITDSILSLPSQFKDVRINYHAIHFYAAESIKYKYRLLGYNEKWSEETRERYVVYTNLSPGEYTFEVLACNIDGYWSEAPAEISFHIIPAFWQTLQFRLVVNFIILIILLLVIFIIYTYFRRRKEARQKTERQISELQLKTIRSQMDPHFTFNALNTISSVIYKEDKEKAYRYFTKFSRLVRASLEVSDKISRSLKEEMDFTRDYLDMELMRFGEGFKFVIMVDQEVDQQLMVPKMIVQNYAENAVKHGLKPKIADRNLWIRVSKLSSSLQIIIEDNGIGRKQAARSEGMNTGKGLQIMNSIYDLYFKLYRIKISQRIEDLYNSEGEATGTKVILSFPLL